MSHHCCGILFIRSLSVSPAHVESEGVSHQWEYQEAGLNGDHPRVCQSHAQTSVASPPMKSMSAHQPSLHAPHH